MYNMVTGSIVTYNNISTIAKTLETLFKETQDVDFKLYVVDNGSSDGTPEYIEKSFPQVSVIRSEKNVGFGAGHNIVINSVDSSYHAIINPDIVLNENVIKKWLTLWKKTAISDFFRRESVFPTVEIRYSASAIRSLNISLPAG